MMIRIQIVLLPTKIQNVFNVVEETCIAMYDFRFCILLLVTTLHSRVRIRSSAPKHFLRDVSDRFYTPIRFITSLVGKKLQYSSDSGVCHHSNGGLAVHKELNELHDLEFH